jgi:hypothetical protein
MSENGEYSVWYHTPRGESAGRLVLEDGKITGEGTALSYSGSYVMTGDRFIATIRTWRRNRNAASVLGVDDLEIVVAGKAPSGKIVASCKGYATNAPDITFDVTLVRIQD